MISHSKRLAFGHNPGYRTFSRIKPNVWSRFKHHWRVSRLLRQLNLSVNQQQQFDQFQHSWSLLRQQVVDLQTRIFQDVAFNLGSPLGSHVLTDRMLDTVGQNIMRNLDEPVHQLDALLIKLDHRQRDILQQFLNEMDD